MNIFERIEQDLAGLFGHLKAEEKKVIADLAAEGKKIRSDVDAIMVKLGIEKVSAPEPQPVDGEGKPIAPAATPPASSAPATPPTS